MFLLERKINKRSSYELNVLHITVGNIVHSDELLPSDGDNRNRRHNAFQTLAVRAERPLPGRILLEKRTSRTHGPQENSVR